MIGQVVRPGLESWSGGFGWPALEQTHYGNSLSSSVTLSTPTSGFNGYDAFQIGVYSDNYVSIPRMGISLGSALGIYSVKIGQKITPSFISSGLPLADNWGNSGGFETPKPLSVGSSMYLAFWRDNHLNPTSYSFEGDYPPLEIIDSGDQIGWAKITRTSTSLVLSASALDVSGNGIIAGGYTSIIPEPSTYAAILGIAVFGFVAVRRRRKA